MYQNKQKLQKIYATSENSDQSAHLRSLSESSLCALKSIGSLAVCSQSAMEDSDRRLNSHRLT